MANVKAVIEFIKLFLTFYSYVAGRIDQAVFHSRIEKIKTAVQKAQTGALADRLQGGSDVEDNFNRHSKP